MAKEKDPAFLFYPKDWIQGTAEYSSVQKGVMIDLMAHMHQEGSIPADVNKIARLARLSLKEFLPIWNGISDKWDIKIVDQEDRSLDRLVNRKLNKIMAERAIKGHKNTIIGTFASLLRLNKISAKDHKQIKSLFKVDDFMATPTERITERLTEWLQNALKSIGNGNGINTISNYEYITISGFREILEKWLLYKKSRRESYKTESGVKEAYNLLVEYSNSDPVIASKIISKSIASNYAGFFPYKDENSKLPEISKVESAKNTYNALLRTDND